MSKMFKGDEFLISAKPGEEQVFIITKAGTELEMEAYDTDDSYLEYDDYPFVAIYFQDTKKELRCYFKPINKPGAGWGFSDIYAAIFFYSEVQLKMYPDTVRPANENEGYTLMYGED